MVQAGSSPDEILRRIYYDQANSASFSTDKILYKAAKEHYSELKLKDVQAWLKREITYTLHRPTRKRFVRNPIRVSKIDEQWEADIVEMQDFKRVNNGYRYILTMIDSFSKYAFAVPLRDKTGGSVATALREIFSKRHPQNLRTDKGKEFLNAHVQKLLKDLQINFFTSNDSTIKCAIVERFNRTLKGRMFKYFTANGTRKYVNILPDLLTAYNNSHHRSIGMTPSQVTYFNSSKVYSNLYNGKENTIKTKGVVIGSSVRAKYDQKPFNKAFYPNWEDQVQRVVQIKKDQNRPTYVLEQDDGTRSKRKFYPEEIQEVAPSTYRIEKVMRRRTQNGIKQLYVKWLGYSDVYNSWVNESDIVSLK